MSRAPTPASPLEALKAGFRRACVRRLVGDEAGAVKVLRDEIPGLVVGWAKNNSLDPADKKAKLKEMFDDESGRADELAVAFDLFAGRFETRVAELVKKEVAGLADHIKIIAKELSSAVQCVGGLTQKLSDSDNSSTDDKSKHPPLTESLSKEIISVDTQTKLPIDMPVEKVKVEDNQVLLSEELEADSPLKVKESVVAPDIQTVEEQKDDFSELDPPSGTGLRFDEIEEMIDEILSYDTK